MDSSHALSRACRSLTLVVATAALTVGISGVALAGSTNVSNNTVTYTGGPGEYNNVRTGYDTTSPNGPWIVVQETNANYTNDHGPNCTNANPSNTAITDPQTVWCPAGGVTQVVLNGGDKDDSLTVSSFGNASSVFPPAIGFNFDGGDGNDTVTLPGTTTTSGPPGSAIGPTGTATGGNGNDTVSAFDGQTANGGAGDDTVNASGPFTGEKAPFSGATLNGEAGQDALNGSGFVTPDRLNGGEGDDVLFPGAGPEDLVGGNGNDAVNWSFGGGPGNGVNVSLDNAPNDGSNGQGANAHSDIETLLGSGGGFFGTPATDVLTGAPGVANFIDGFGGNDTFNVASNPADPDVVICGDGFVTINADAKDVFDTVGRTGCHGQINKPPVASGVTLKIRSGSAKLDSDGHVGIKVGCRGTGTCRGVLELDKSGTALGTSQFVIPNGQTRKVAVLPRPAYAKRLKAGKSIKVSATADATDSGGATGSTTSTVNLKGKHKK